MSTMPRTAIGTPRSFRPASLGAAAGACGAGDAIAGRRAIFLQLVDIGEDLRDGAVEGGRNLLAYFNRLVQRLRQRRILDDRNQVLDRELADPQRQIVLALGHHDRRPHGLDVIADCYGKMRRIHDHGGGRRNLAHHAAAQRVAPQLPDPLLDLRVALGLLRLVANLLLAHLHFLRETPLLPRQVDRAPDQKHVHRFPQQIVDRRSDSLKAGGDRLKRQHHQRRKIILRHRVNR